MASFFTFSDNVPQLDDDYCYIGSPFPITPTAYEKLVYILECSALLILSTNNPHNGNYDKTEFENICHIMMPISRAAFKLASLIKQKCTSIRDLYCVGNTNDLFKQLSEKNQSCLPVVTAHTGTSQSLLNHALACMQCLARYIQGDMLCNGTMDHYLIKQLFPLLEFLGRTWVKRFIAT